MDDYTMNVSSSVHAPSIVSCCATDSEPSPWTQRTDVICRIALTALAAAIAPWPMLISFSAGLIAGSVYAAVKLIQKQPMFPNGESKPVCAQGYMDFLSGMRFPPLIGTAATTAFIAAHMRHDPQFYVPFCGLFTGFWIGRETAILAESLIHQKPTPKSCCHAS